MGRILVHDIHHISYSSYMGRTRPTRRVDISSLRWVLQMKNKKDTQQLATLVYVHAMKKQIEKEVEDKYLKRINYLVGANNELMKELGQCEEERVRMTEIADSILLSRE
jgi:hypothetical protein